MNRRCILSVSAITALALALLQGSAFAQQKKAQGQAPRQTITGAKVSAAKAAGRSQASKQTGSASQPGRSGAAPSGYNNRRFEDGEF
jgi:hypothetical protein